MIACAYFPFFSAAGLFFFGVFAGRLFPNEPLEILPFLVLISPLPICCNFYFFKECKVAIKNLVGHKKAGTKIVPAF